MLIHAAIVLSLKVQSIIYTLINDFSERPRAFLLYRGIWLIISSLQVMT